MLISQQLDIWDTPRNCWVPNVESNWTSTVLSFTSIFFWNENIDTWHIHKHKCWYYWFRYSISNQRVWPLPQHSHRQSGGPPWKSPFSSMSLSMMAREVADMRMGASKPCLIVFRCSTFAHHFLKTKNCWKQMLTLVVGNLAPKSSSPLKLSSGFPHSSQRGKLKYIPILPMPIGVEDYKKSIKHTIIIFLMLLIVFWSSTHPW